MKLARYLLTGSIIASLLFITGCEKPPGEGGTSTIRGKIYIRDYNSTFTILQDEYYAMEERVYIIYGNNSTFYDDDIRTSYDGSYEFRYLRKGTYSVFAYSDDSTFTQPGGMFPVIKTVEITEENQTIEVPTIVLLK